MHEVIHENCNHACTARTAGTPAGRRGDFTSGRDAFRIRRRLFAPQCGISPNTKGFNARGFGSRHASKKSGVYYSSDEVLQELDDILVRAKKKAGK